MSKHQRHLCEVHGARIVSFFHEAHLAIVHLEAGKTTADYPDLFLQENEFYRPSPIPVIDAEWIRQSIFTGLSLDWKTFLLQPPLELEPALPTPPLHSTPLPPTAPSRTAAKKTSKRKRRREPSTDNDAEESKPEVPRKVARPSSERGDAGPGLSTPHFQRRAQRIAVNYRDVDSDISEAASEDNERDPLDVISERSSLLAPCHSDAPGPHHDNKGEGEGEGEGEGDEGQPSEPKWRKNSHRAAALELIAELRNMPDKSDMPERDFFSRKFGSVRRCRPSLTY
jgi:hypothetical protein